MSALTGRQIKDTYDKLILIEDDFTTNYVRLEIGNGVDLPISVSNASGIKFHDDVITLGLLTATELAGDGAQITNLDATALAGQISSSNLSTFRSTGNSWSATQTFTGGAKITGLGTPTSASDAVTKSYVDGVAAGVVWVPAVRAASSQSISDVNFFSNADFDNVVLNTGDRVLVKDGIDALDETNAGNGIYTVAFEEFEESGTLTRTSDVIESGIAVFVQEGDTQADTAWLISTDGDIDVGVDPIIYVQFGGGTGASLPSQGGHAGEFLTTNGSVASWAAITGSGGSSGANPTASVGLTAVNGSAGTFLRSDGAPALSQSITPVWTGQHKFTSSSPTVFRQNGGTASVDEIQVSHDGSKGLIESKDGTLDLKSTGAIRVCGTTAVSLPILGSIFDSTPYCYIQFTDTNYINIGRAGESSSIEFKMGPSTQINLGYGTFDVGFERVSTGTGLVKVTNGSTGGGSLMVRGSGIASQPALSINGNWFVTGGSATTTKPQLLIEPSGTTSTAWSTTGTGFGINAPSGFTGILIDAKVNNTSKFQVEADGDIVCQAISCTNVTGKTALLQPTSNTTQLTVKEMEGGGQSSNLTEWRDSSDNVLALISSEGVLQARAKSNVQTLSGTYTATFASDNCSYLFLDPNGSDRTVTLWASPQDGDQIAIKNTGGANQLNVKNNGGTSLIDLDAGETVCIIYDSDWLVF